MNVIDFMIFKNTYHLLCNLKVNIINHLRLILPIPMIYTIDSFFHERNTCVKEDKKGRINHIKTFSVLSNNLQSKQLIWLQNKGN